MRAWYLDRLTGLDALRLDEAAIRPSPGLGEVLVRVRFAALNPADRFLAQNQYPARAPLPHILGRDGCGIVEAVGDGVKMPRVGDRIAVLRGAAGVDRPGTFAEYVVVSKESVASAPTEWDDPQVAAAPLVYVTAHQALNQWGPLPPSIVIIPGVSGGVGLAALQLAKAYGHRVIGLSRNATKSPRLMEMGCDLLLHPADEQLKRKVKEFTAGKGVDLVVDGIGGDSFHAVLDTLGYGGRMSVVGALGGDVPALNTAKLIFRRIRIGGVAVHDYTPEQAHRAWGEIIALLNARGVRPVVDSIFPMERLPEAFQRLAEGPLGKVLLKVNGGEDSVVNSSSGQ